jgi:signal transduction histidine kinase/sugar lactone lactonase YvrE
MRGDSLWATNAFSVMLFRKNRLVKTWDFSNEGQFIHEILVDRAGHVWFCQDGTDSVSTFDLNLSRKKMRVPVQPGSNVIALCEGSAGMYAISNSSRSYLFLKERGSDVFKDISVKPAFPVHEELGLVDIAMHENRVWLASSQGLLRYYNGRLEKIDLGTRYKNHSVKVVHSFDKEHILFGNAFGLFLYNTVTGYILLYDETTGLPSNATTPRGICVASTGQIWVGTSYGVSFSSSPLKSQGKSPAPMVSSIRVNGITAMLTNQLEVPYHSLVSITVSAPIFPEKMMQLEWRVPGSTPEWHVIENDQFDLVEVSEGVMEVEIRARKMGYDYSDFAVVHINVSGPFWQSAYFVIGVILLIALVVWVSVAVTKQNQRKRQQWLEQQIQIHTQELSLRNKELDSFVYSTSHDLSAPLRSILGLITVARMENPPPNQLEYLAKMEQSVHKLQNFIKDVINYSRNLRMPVKREDIDFVPFVNAILADHQFANNFGKIEFEVIDSVKSPVVLDSLRLRIILNNLISNAIKFHWIGRPNEAPKVWIELSRQQNLLRLVVKDNGRGIDSVHMKNLFGMFYRATDNAAGSGLGLYILKEAVTKMGGKVTVQSALGEGTEFTITIPHFESADPPADV